MALFVLVYIIGFVRTLIVLAIIYFGIRLLTRYVLPLLLDKGVKNMHQKMQNQQRPRRPEGEVTIEKKRSRKNQQNPRDGEYVDFEEVD